MIIASEGLKTYIEFQMDRAKLIEALEIHPNTLANILKGETISAHVATQLLKETKFSFEKAFIVLPDKKDRVKK